MASIKSFPTIKSIKTYIIDGSGSGGDYHNVAGGHWCVPSIIRP
jgi:L-rhamnonate dehydratase